MMSNWRNHLGLAGASLDQVPAQYYSFTGEELDFIINCDIKYRMGDALGKEEDDNL
jgi:hypothetical protein